MTAYTYIPQVAAARSFMLTADLIRLYQQMGYQFADHDRRLIAHMDARARLDALVPEKPRPTKWQWHERDHIITLEPARRGTSVENGLVRAVCSCGEYTSGVLRPSEAWRNGRAHAFQKRPREDAPVAGRG